jgi:signal transduction histidine kinase
VKVTSSLPGDRDRPDAPGPPTARDPSQDSSGQPKSPGPSTDSGPGEDPEHGTIRALRPTARTARRISAGLTARLTARSAPRLSGIDLAWAIFSLLNLIAIFWFEDWETIPFHFIWISLTVLYGFRNWASRPTMWVLAIVMVTTSAGIGLDVYRGTEPAQELTEVPLMAAVFWAMVWHVHRKQAAENEYHVISEANARMLSVQRQFVQDAAHQLRTPITIALGHAELLADSLAGRATPDRPAAPARAGSAGAAGPAGAAAGADADAGAGGSAGEAGGITGGPGLRQERQDIRVVIGELNRLRRIAQKLLVIAAVSDPEFLLPEPVPLDQLAAEVICRWRPTASRRWQLGRLDAVTLRADKERLSLAIDALLDNAVRHTAEGDVIQLSVVRSEPGAPARLIVSDGGSGIPVDQQHLIFDRFRTGHGAQSRGTGLGLALVRAVARAHGGDVCVRSTLGAGSEFEVTLPAPADSGREAGAAGQRGSPDGEGR